MVLKKNISKSFFFSIKLIFSSKIFLQNFLKQLNKKNKIRIKSFSFQFLKRRIKQFVFIKSPHVNKKSKEHFCFFKYPLVFNIIASLKNLLKILKKLPLFVNFYILYYNLKKFKKFKQTQKIFHLLKINFIRSSKKISN